MKTFNYDAIIIGAGHNGLVAAAYLAKKGKKTLVLERRSIPGGSVITETFGEGFSADSLYAGGALHAGIAKDLNLGVHGLPIHADPRPFASLLEGNRHLVIDPDPAKAAEAIKPFSEKDALRWGEFVRFMNVSARILESAYATIMPRLPKDFNIREGFGLMNWGMKLRLSSRKDMLNFIRALPMTVQELVDEYFESEVLKAAVASLGIHGVTLGPMGAGTGYTLIHNWMNRRGLAHPNVGGAGKITTALSNAVKAFGGEIRLNAEVKHILIENQTANGVLLSNGEEIFAPLILSAADPKHTMMNLVGTQDLPPEFVWHTQSIKMRGSVAKVHIKTNGQHGIPPGTIVLSPSIKYVERAYDAAKYGEISEKPYLEITSHGDVVSIHFQYAPFLLKHGSWAENRESIVKIAIETLAPYFSGLQPSVINTHVITPQDIEETYGATEGDLNHGQLMLDQFLFMRPIPGWANHKTPIDNLFLCGSGVHGGGGVSGAAGRNVIKVLS